MSNNNQEKKHPLVSIGIVLMVVGAVLSKTTLTVNGVVMEFISSAAPWVLLGLGLACVLAGSFAGKKKDR